MIRLTRPALGMNSCHSVLLIFAFSAWAGDAARGQSGSAIFVMEVDGSNVEKVSHSDDRYLGGLAWSHDGNRLIYMGASASKELYMETLGEGKPRHLGSGGAPCWSPDDQQIAFFQEEKNAAGDKPGVWIMSSDGGGAMPAMIPGQSGKRNTDPVFSPDGKRIAFCSSRRP